MYLFKNHTVCNSSFKTTLFFYPVTVYLRSIFLFLEKFEPFNSSFVLKSVIISDLLLMSDP